LASPYLLDYFIALSSVEIPGYLEIRPDLAALIISTAIIVLTGVLAGILPSVLGVRAGIAGGIREGAGTLTGSRRGHRTGNALVAGEVALTVVLVVASGLLLRSYHALYTTDLGFRTEGALRMALFVDPSDLPENDLLPAFYDRVKETILGYPGVERATFLYPTLPLLNASEGRLRYPGMPEGLIEHGLATGVYFVDEDFFSTLEIPLAAGRAIERQDSLDRPLVAVVSRSLAQRMGGIDQAMGTQLEMDGGEYRVVGVAEDARFGGPAESGLHDLELYAAMYQHPRRLVSMSLITQGDPLTHAAELRRRLAAVAPRSAVDWVDDVEHFMSWTYRDAKFYTLFVGGFTFSALGLMTVGLYALLANLVTGSTMEIGLRKSLGATPVGILLLTLRRGLAVVASGLAVGFVLSMLSSRALEGLLYGVQPFDMVTFVLAALVLLLLALLASFIPARRAASIDAMRALRSE